MVGINLGVANARPYHFITHVAGDVDYWPRFSPDGNTILFSRCEITTPSPGCRAQWLRSESS